MSQSLRSLVPNRLLKLSLVFLVAITASPTLQAEQLFRFKNGLVVRGLKNEIPTLKDGFGAAAAGDVAVRPIWVIDDGLRRIFVHGQGMGVGNPVEVADLESTIELWQPVPLGGKAVSALGDVLQLSQFNKIGRRSVTIRSKDGPFQLHQGITELNSRYARVRALKGKPSLMWDMRVATSSIDSLTLKRIFEHKVARNDMDGRLQVVRFFISAQRYEDAWQLLSDVIDDFPEEVDLKPQLAALTEQQAEQLLTEAQLRAEVGQPQLARNMLNEFPRGAVSRVMRIKVDDALAELNKSRDDGAEMIKRLRAQIATLDKNRAGQLQGIVDEMEAGLSSATLPRLSDYSLKSNVDNLPIDNRIALAIAGWLLGSGSGEQNLTVVTSLIKVRDLVAEYLGESDPLRRQSILDQLRNLEGAEAEYVDRILPLLPPPLPLPESAESEEIAGMFMMTVGEQKYVVQLPPEYDPLRQYPCVLALHESTASPQSQIDWWAGNQFSQKLQSRVGYASRYGFIVVAPVWTRPNQRRYEYTPKEHQRVLVCLRDAMRRTAIDSDRVFIAGHGEGGTAAWDIALSHPDIWAGMISLSGSPSVTRTVPHYKDNSEFVPMYIVMGDRDANKPAGTLINDYMTFKHDAMIVMYRGRGREYFYDEMPRIFDWMRLAAHKRKDPPRDFEVATMRSGDQFFWWVELEDLKPDLVIDPVLWNEENKRIRAAPVTGTIGDGNQIRVRGPSDRIKLCLRPQPGIDMYERIVVRYGSRPRSIDFNGSIDVMLEDARRRAERKRPFWIEETLR